MSYARHPPSFAHPMTCLEPLAEFTRDGQAFRRWRLATIDPATEQVASFAEFDFPAHFYPRMVGKRFAVATEATSTLVLDTQASEPVLVFHATPRLEGRNGLRELGDSLRFLRTNRDLLSAQHPLPTCWIELFELDGDGIPNLINRWPALCDSEDHWNIVEIDENLVSIHPTNGTFEIRSQVDGSLRGSHPLPSGFNPATDKWYLYSDRLTVGSGGKTYSFRTRRWLNVPEGYYSYYKDSPQKSLRLWSEPIEEANASQVDITNADSEEPVARFKFTEPIHVTTFLTDEKIVFVTPRWGYTLGMFNARTGELMNVWRPYWWAFPALLISVSAYMIWCVVWLADTTGRWAWADIALLSLMPIVALSVRSKFVGDFQDKGRESYAIIEGMFVAILFLASLWMFSPRGRLVQRVLPIMLSLATIGIALAFCFADKIEIASSLLLPNLLLTMACIVASLGLKLAGWQLDTAEVNSQAPTSNTSLQEMFVLVAVSALLFAPMRSMLPDLSSLRVVLNEWMYGVLLVVPPAFAWILAISRNNYLYRLGWWLTIGIIGFLQLYLYHHFIEGSWLFRFYNVLDSVLIIVTSSFVATFVLSHAFYQRRLSQAG